MGLFISLDSLKKSKTCIANDISMYKRTLSFVVSDVTSTSEMNQEINECQTLTLFMAQQDHFKNFLLQLFDAQHIVWMELSFELVQTISEFIEKKEDILLFPMEQQLHTIVSFNFN
jgi:hypothetical protein